METARPIMACVETTALVISRIFVSREKILDDLQQEKIAMRIDDSPFAYELKNLDSIHARAGSLISHLSIMLALCMFAVGSEELSRQFGKVVVFDMLIYLILLLMAVVVLRPIGFDLDTEQGEKFEEYILTQIAKKHAIARSVAAGTIIATLILIVPFVSMVTPF